jgi:hypothetical protein
MKLTIGLMKDRPMPSKADSSDSAERAARQSEAVAMPMDRRVQYAIDCIEGDSPEAADARSFLQKVLAKKLIADNAELEDKVKGVLA